MRELALFAGAGGGLLGSRLLGWTPACAVEIDPYARAVLLARQRDGLLDRFPIWDDVCTFDGRPWRGHIDVVSGGFPCQDISSAGQGRGLAGPRSGLWFEMLRVIGEVRPRFVWAENSPNLRTRGLGIILEGLTGLGYDVRWGVLGARHVGAPHRRDRMWLLADADDGGQRAEPIDAQACSAREAMDVAEGPRPLAHAHCPELREQSRRGGGPDGAIAAKHRHTRRWPECPDLAGVGDGLAHRVDRVRATGNGQVPAVAALAYRILSDGVSSNE